MEQTLTKITQSVDRIRRATTPRFNRSVIRANGNSMLPVLKDGDLVAVRQVFNFDLILYGQMYFVVLDEFQMIKYIRRYEPDEDFVILRSANNQFDDMKIHKSKIRQLFVVEQTLSHKAMI